MRRACIGLMGLLCAGSAWADDVESALARLRAEVGESADLTAIETAYVDATNRLATAELDAAVARTRMASHTAAILCRELKKVSASARLVEMTRKTGRSEEVARYERRHATLLDAIDKIAAEYRLMIEDLCAMEDDLVTHGFSDYEKRLVKLEVADAIRVNNRVKAHYDACRAGGDVSLDQWKKELEEL